MNLSIIVTTRNRYADLVFCIDSIFFSDLSSINWELLIIDDASTDETSTLVLADLGIKNGKVVHNKKNLMMVKSRNIGAKMAKGDYILFIDDDNEVDARMIKILLSFAVANPSFGILGPSMYSFETKEKYLDYQTINMVTGRTVGHTFKSPSEFYFTDGVPNVFMITRSVFDKVGFFDEELIQTFTEPDFSFNAAKLGFKSCIVPKAKTFHKISVLDNLTSRALGGMYKQKAYCLMRNRTVIIARYGSIFSKLVYLLFFSWFWPMVYSLLILREKRFDLVRLYWAGFIDGLIYLFTGKLRNSLPLLLD